MKFLVSEDGYYLNVRYMTSVKIVQVQADYIVQCTMLPNCVEGKSVFPLARSTDSSVADDKLAEIISTFDAVVADL